MALVIYSPTPEPREGSLPYGMRLADLARTVVDNGDGHATLVLDSTDIRRAHRKGIISVILAIENGAVLGGSTASLRNYHRLGVRLLGVTWNGRNGLACGVGCRDTGVTRLGREVIQEAQALGMIIDCSHMGDRSFSDLTGIVKGPFVATHSNARAICGEARNLTDDQIREIAGRGGVVGVNFYPRFLRPQGRGSVEDVVDHIDHLVEIGGIDAVGIGSDFDGIPRAPRGIEHAGEMGNLAESMRKRGYLSTHIGKILEGNFLRVFREVVG